MMHALKHFRTVFLNAFEWFIDFFYTGPIRFFRESMSRKSVSSIIEQVYNANQSDGLKAFSAAFGVFIGIVPIWGFQTLAGICLAMVFKLNKALVVIFSQVSFPPLFPLVIYLSYNTGNIWMPRKKNHFTYSPAVSIHNINQHVEQYLYGSFTLAIAAALVTGTVTLVFLKLLKGVKQYRLAGMPQKSIINN